jgi:hypothetical protein
MAVSMSPVLFIEKRPSLFYVAAPTIANVFVRMTVKNTLHSPTSIEHSIVQAGKNTLIGGEFFQKEVKDALYKIQAIRWTIRKVLMRWLYSRLRSCTTTDIVTLEPIQRPVHIIDWPNRHRYSFELQTLHRDCSESLSHGHGMFASPLRPKNPLTNLHLSLGQLVSVWASFTQGQIPLSSAVVNYRSVQFNHGRFMEEYATPLSIQCMKKCILNPLDLDGGEYLYDFIEATFEYNAIPFSAHIRTKLTTAIYAHKDTDFLRKYRLKCVDYNYIVLTKKQFTALELLQQLYRVYKSCLPLIREYLSGIKGNLL